MTLKGTEALKEKVLLWTKQAATTSSYQAVMHLGTQDRARKYKFKNGAFEFADPIVTTWPPPVQSSEWSFLKNLKLQDGPVPSADSASMDHAEDLRSSNYNHYSRYLTFEGIVLSDVEWRALLEVLSACDTDKGKVTREGVLSLARAFLLGGAPSTIVSQWKVDDNSAPHCMAALYAHMIAGQDVASELREAQVYMIGTSPFQVHQWAPFLVMGLGTVSPRPVGG